MDQSTKKKPVRSAAGKEKRTSYKAVWLKGQRLIYMRSQAHEQQKLCKANGILKSDSNLAGYLISLEFRRQERQANSTFHGPPFCKTQRFANKIPHTRRLSRTKRLFMVTWPGPFKLSIKSFTKTKKNRGAKMEPCGTLAALCPHLKVLPSQTVCCLGLLRKLQIKKKQFA